MSARERNARMMRLQQRDYGNDDRAVPRSTYQIIPDSFGCYNFRVLLVLIRDKAWGRAVTPIGSRLQLKLDDEVVRMANEWFFKWHHIGGERAVEIDSFRGKPIVYGGIRFSGTAHNVYWNTIQYYLRKKISSLFDELEQEIKSYDVEVRRQAIDEARLLIRGFAGRIRRMAVEKDRILRGDGMNFPTEHDFGTWQGSGVKDIESRADSLVAIHCQSTPLTQALWEQANALWDKHRWWVGIAGLIMGVVGLLVAF